MTDTELLDFVEERGIQLWAHRKSKHGPVTHWWAQNTLPFIQTYGPTVRVVLAQLKKKLDEK